MQRDSEWKMTQNVKGKITQNGKLLSIQNDSECRMTPNAKCKMTEGKWKMTWNPN